MSELCTADASTGFRDPSTDAGYEAQFARTGVRTGSAGFLQLLANSSLESAIAAEKREVPKRLRCHRFEVGRTVRIRLPPAENRANFVRKTPYCRRSGAECRELDAAAHMRAWPSMGERHRVAAASSPSAVISRGKSAATGRHIPNNPGIE
jgi:hypothetical protein